MPDACSHPPYRIAILGVYVLLLAAGFDSAASRLHAQPAQVRQAAELPPALARIVDSSRQTPPEFHAYALLVLVESGRIENKASARKLLREAFEAAQTVTQKIGRLPALNIGPTTDSDVGVFLFKRNFALDRTSLEARAIADAERLDPAMARTMFGEANWSDSEPAACRDAMVDDPENYYTLLTALARNKAANRKQDKDRSELLLEAGIERVHTHYDAELALRTINQSALPASQYEETIHLYIDRLVRLRGDERGFAERLPQLQNQGSGGWTGNLKTVLGRADPADAQTLLRTFRDYLVENLRAGVCGESWAHRKDALGKPLVPRGIESFNQQLAAELVRNGVKPIAPEEIASDAPEVKAEMHAYGQSQEARDLTQAAEQLRVNASGEPRTLEERNSAAWAEQFTRFLGRVDDWAADPFRSEDELWMKMKFYTGSIYLAPTSDERWMAMERAVAMLENSNLETEDPALEMVLASLLHLLAIAQENGNGLEKRSGDALNRRLAASRSPSLRLLGLMEAEKLKALHDSL